MTHEAAGVSTTRNDDDRQDNDRQREQHAPNEPLEQHGQGEPFEQHGPAGAGPETGADGGSGAAAGSAGDGAAHAATGGSEGGDVGGSAGGSAGGDAGGSAGGDAGGRTDGRTEGERPEARLARAVRAAEQALIEFEIAVETFRVEVENFSRLHHQKLGPMYTRLDELDAQIAEARAARTGDPEDIRKAQEARAVVMPMPGVEELFHDWIDSDGLSPEAAAMLTEQPVRPPKRVRPTEEARKLYRDLARQAHPDLAQDETERARRDEFIARVNAAYGRGDEALLMELAQEWAAGPAAPETELSESEELYARLNWLTQRKELLTVLAQELEESAIGSMLRMAPDDPDRLLDEIAEQLLGEVAQREAELAGMVQ
ncbi:J domain-containing protein [Streptomyces sp. NBC_00439]|uniref:J domain-containing protein n=1 Tax=unclassified Streptomyces TaxID=2593676 RepID=UPI0022584D20|nr:J domain-containing protein [Streptomyces sp. NBC_00439]MCX5101914.1 J domain-containing protein [Streptomyces sp. NBC_00439]